MRARRAVVAGAALVALALLAGCTGGSGRTGGASPPASSTAVSAPIDLTFGVYGSAAELTAYRQVVAVWNRNHARVHVRLTSVADSAAGLNRLAAAGPAPDVFLVDRLDLGSVLRDRLTQPVGELLDQPGRDVDFGDGYVIDAVRAFSGDDDLQCMPYGYSPMVIYRNTRLVDFRQMARAGYAVPTRGGRWTFQQFSDAAEWAARPGSGAAAGLAVDPTLTGLAPFIYSGGGQLFDDPAKPTSLAFSSSSTQQTLDDVLGLLRDPLVNLSTAQRAQQSPVQWFQQGKLGLMAGYRSLTPQLRQATSLHWDVMPMPVLSDKRTVGDVTGLCLSKTTAHTEQAADFLYYASSANAVSTVARTGYLDPANLAVAASDAFRQPGQRPRSSTVFAYTTRDIVLPPELDTWAELDAAVAGDLRTLVTTAVPPANFLPALGARIDRDSQAVLDPPTTSAAPSTSSGGG